MSLIECQIPLRFDLYTLDRQVADGFVMPVHAKFYH